VYGLASVSAMPPSPTLRSSGDLLADRRYAYAEAALKDGDHRAAAELAEQCLERAPSFAAAHALLGRARAALGEHEAALAALMRALDCDPQDALGVRIDLARLGALPPQEAIGAGYVRALFDDYAGTFDKQLVRHLHYRGPELLRAAVRRAFAVDGRKLWAERVLDLGCGTGLVGQAFAGCYRYMEGVDLSPRMLAAARRIRLYDRLHEGDLLGFLREQPERAADLVLAADVFVYLAALDEVFAEVGRVLEPRGFFAFTVQAHDGEGVHLGADSRYAHSEGYLRATAERAGFSVALFEAVSTRQDRGVAVPGFLMVLERGGGPETTEA
jgi:predicted TPR repeat methyltransferase